MSQSRRQDADRRLAEIVRDGIPEYEMLVARILADGLPSDNDEYLLKGMLISLKELAGRLMLRAA